MNEKTVRFYLIDDSSDFASDLKRFLEALSTEVHLEVTICNDFDEANSKIESLTDVDIFLIDLYEKTSKNPKRLRGMNLIKRVRKVHGTRPTIVAISEGSDDGKNLRNTTRVAGADTFYLKAEFFNSDDGDLVAFLEDVLRVHSEKNITNERKIDHVENASKTIFLVQGRDQVAIEQVTLFLQALDLTVLQWSDVKSGMPPNPFVLDIVREGFRRAGAAVVLLSGDDEARLRSDLRGTSERAERLTAQPRQNVLLEGGMALGHQPARTVLIKFGSIRAISDVGGMHIIDVEGWSDDSRTDFLNSLEAAGLDVNRKGSRWMKVPPRA
jgi:predicted nucleotide-binding protein